ncbi:HAMP domain-containing sensor histidine kinase [Nocardioides sp. YIM 152588]|uniref:sensor histidine kinase n=1 Tax=Nocardioides sp. YIM 152588 TaxID=3158259 RepID=UPI0032E4B3F5
MADGRAPTRPAHDPAASPVGTGRFARAGARTTVGIAIDAALAVFVTACLVLMWAYPEPATIPYHLIFVSIMLVYGFRIWPVPATLAVVGVLTVITGLLMVDAYEEGVIDLAELSEIPLMPALLVTMMWHARRRAAAHRELERMSTVQRDMLERERSFFRDTSHAIRTPVTIARGHLELASGNALVPTVREDLETTLRQLDRMSVLSNRLLALAQIDAGEVLPAQRVDLADFVGEVGANWSAEPGRSWAVDVDTDTDAVVDADPVWLALAVDALVENAVHHTADHGCIEIRGTASKTTCSIVVADDGAGIAPADLEHVFHRFWHRRPPNGPMGSGLGLSMARATARAWGGDVRASNRPTGGAVLELVLPRSDAEPLV